MDDFLVVHMSDATFASNPDVAVPILDGGANAEVREAIVHGEIVKDAISKMADARVGAEPETPVAGLKHDPDKVVDQSLRCCEVRRGTRRHFEQATSIRTQPEGAVASTQNVAHMRILKAGQAICKSSIALDMHEKIGCGPQAAIGIERYCAEIGVGRPGKQQDVHRRTAQVDQPDLGTNPKVSHVVSEDGEHCIADERDWSHNAGYAGRRLLIGDAKDSFANGARPEFAANHFAQSTNRSPDARHGSKLIAAGRHAVESGDGADPDGAILRFDNRLDPMLIVDSAERVGDRAAVGNRVQLRGAGPD